MNDRIKEKLALHRVIFATGTLSNIGLIAWVYQIYDTSCLSYKFWEGFILTILFTFVNIFYYITLSKFTEKIK